MLGITTPDAIAFGSLCAALLAAYTGLVKGDKAKHDDPPEPTMAMIGGALVDRSTLQDLTEAVRDLVSVMRSGLAVDEARSRDHLADTMRELLERLDHGKRR